MREFVIGVQPILLARCGSVKCHGTADPKTPSTTSSFHLEHVRISQGSNRAATARNLEAVLKLLDGQFPSQSPFFQKGLQPHGGIVLRNPLDGAAGRAQEMRLRRWVESIAPERNRIAREQASRDFIGRFSRSANAPTLRDPNVVPAGATMGDTANAVVPPERTSPRVDAAAAFHNSNVSPKPLGPQTDAFDPARIQLAEPARTAHAPAADGLLVETRATLELFQGDPLVERVRLGDVAGSEHGELFECRQLGSVSSVGHGRGFRPADDRQKLA